MSENQILTRIDLERALARLHPADAMMMKLIYQLEQPDDWSGRWPPKFEDIGHYIGVKYEGAPLSEAAIRYRRDVVRAQWAGKRGKLRRNPQNRDLQKGQPTSNRRK